MLSTIFSLNGQSFKPTNAVYWYLSSTTKTENSLVKNDTSQRYQTLRTTAFVPLRTPSTSTQVQTLPGSFFTRPPFLVSYRGFNLLYRRHINSPATATFAAGRQGILVHMSSIQAPMHWGAPATNDYFDPSVFEHWPNPVIFGRYLPSQQACSEPVINTSDDVSDDTASPSSTSSPYHSTEDTSSPTSSSDTDSGSSSSSSFASTPRSDPPSPASDTVYPHQCTQCSESYRLLGDLRKHWYRRHEKRFECDVCPQRFNLKADLKRHANSKHAAKAEIMCDIRGCPAIFTRRDNMMRHIREEHEHGGRKGR